MGIQSQTQELLELVHETQKHLKYLQELGVEGIQKHDNDIIPDVKHEQSTNSATSLASGKQLLNQGRGAKIDQITKEHPSKDSSTSLFGELTPQPAQLAPSTETFEEIWLEVGDCTRCPLHQGRTNIVHTEGNRRARLMFIGEAPGADEDAQARPFVGRAGQLLTKIIEAIGFKREDVLIGNVNRCRPAGNRPPTEEEATMCKPFLLREIASVLPAVIVVMGNTATRNLLNAKLGITKLRGEFQDYHGVKVMPTFHPAYLLRDPSKKQETWKDLKKVRDYLETTAKR